MNISRKDFFAATLHMVCAAGFVLLAVQMMATRTDDYFFLLWNLFLAAVPYALSLSFERAVEMPCAPNRRMQAGVIFLLWLFFFPNAPYIVTDFIHLPWEYTRSFLFWYDFFLIASFSCAGLLFGMASLFRVHRSLRKILGKLFADGTILVMVFLSGFGVYLGRFLRWNSWDVFVSAEDLFFKSLSYFGDPALFRSALFLSFLFSIFIGISYGVFLGAYRLLGKEVEIVSAISKSALSKSKKS